MPTSLKLVACFVVLWLFTQLVVIVRAERLYLETTRSEDPQAFVRALHPLGDVMIALDGGSMEHEGLGFSVGFKHTIASDHHDHFLAGPQLHYSWWVILGKNKEDLALIYYDYTDPDNPVRRPVKAAQ